MSLPRYSSYKDSGVEWLGEVPSHWEVLALKYCLYSIISGITADQVEEGDETVPVTRIETISGGIFNHERLGFIKRNDARLDKKLYRGDILFSNINSLNMIGNCAVYSEDAEIFAGMNLLVLRPRTGNNAKWLYYYVRSSIFRQIVESLSKPAINQASIPQSAVAAIRICAPTTNEQTAIAEFLDRETGKIDALVAEQERLIALLTEKRQAVISHAVTKGLNPTAPMKPSGIDWLGDIPSHWDIKQLKHIGDAQIGLTYDPSELVNEDEGVLVLRSSNVQQGQICYDDNVYVSKEIPEKLITRSDDILICSRNGSRALIGKNALISGNAIGVTFGAFMTIFRSSLNKYLVWVLGSQIFEFQSGSFLTSTINQLTIGNLYSFTIPIPPQEEREKIGHFLSIKTGEIDLLISQSKTAISLLQERRTALISAAVTGKIDVRGQARKEKAA